MEPSVSRTYDTYYSHHSAEYFTNVSPHRPDQNSPNHSPSASTTFSGGRDMASPMTSLAIQNELMQNELIQSLEMAQNNLDASLRDAELIANTVEAFQETLLQSSVQNILTNSPDSTTPQMACETSENLLRDFIPALRAQTHVFDGESKGSIRTAFGKLNRLVVQLLREKAELMLGNIVSAQTQGKKGDIRRVLQTAISKEELQKEINSLTARHESLTTKFLQTEEKNTELTAELSRLQDQVAELRQIVSEKDEKIQIAHRQQSHARKDMKRLAQEITTLREQNASQAESFEVEKQGLLQKHSRELNEKITERNQFVSHSEQLESVVEFFNQSVTNATMEMLTITCPTMSTSERCELSNKTLSQLSEAIDEKLQALREFSDAPECVKQIGSIVYDALTQRIRLTKLLNISCWSEIQIGDYVMLTDGRTGECRYVGEIDGKVGRWYGIELALPLGVHNGTLQGRTYFRAGPRCGVFVLRNRIMRILERKGEMVKISSRDLERLQGRLVKLERSHNEQTVKIKALDEIRTSLQQELLMMSQQHASLVEQNESMMALNKNLKVQVKEYLKNDKMRMDERMRGFDSRAEVSYSRSRFNLRSETFDETSYSRGGNAGRPQVGGRRSPTLAYDEAFDEDRENTVNQSGYGSS